MLRHLILDFSDGRDIKHELGEKQEKQKKRRRWPFCEGWCPVSNGTPTHTEWHNTRIRKNKKWHWPFCEGWRPVNNGTPTHTEWHNTRNRMASAFFFSEFAMKLQPGGTAQEERVAASATTLGLAHSQHLRRTTLAPMNGCSSHRRLLHRHRQSPKTSGYPMWTHCLTKFIGSTRS